MFIKTIVAHYNENFSFESDNGYSTLESLLENFCADNPGSLWSVDTTGEGEKRRFKRAFLMCGQFADVCVVSGIRFLAVDSGKLLIPCLLNFCLII